jgi:hypothetical protein
MESEFSLESLLNLTRKDKSGFWKLMYDKVKDSVEYGLDYAVILEFKDQSQESDEMVEVTSFILDKDQFFPFLENYLIFCEGEEEYEMCMEIKKVIEKINSEEDISSDE